jgi:hypothetical protein
MVGCIGGIEQDKNCVSLDELHNEYLGTLCVSEVLVISSTFVKKMKIREAQSATLTNYEVYTHLTEQRARYAKKGMKGRRPGNLETVVKEVGLLQKQYELES